MFANIRKIQYILVSTLLVIAILLVMSAWWAYDQMHNKLAIDDHIILISPGSNNRQVAEILVDHNIITAEWPFIVFSSLKGETRKIKAGEYQISKGSSAAQFLQMIVRGKVISYPITLIEGWTYDEIIQLLDSMEHLVSDISALTDQEVLKKIGSRRNHLEGIFFPDTYYSVRGETHSSVLMRAYAMMEKELDKAWSLRFDRLPLKNQYDALILASIIEKETGRDEERAHISGVLINRLRRNMPLQVDPTIIYGLGKNFDGNLRHKHLKLDGPYNTYLRRGLPPTPISNPGMKSLMAAVQPKLTNDLFFVSRGDGTHVFSKTLEEHRLATDRYQK